MTDKILEFPSRTSSRRRAPKPSAKAEMSREDQILEQCAIYLQSMAAYRAADQIDTGDLDFLDGPAGPCTQYFKAADKAILRLIGLSQAHKPSCPPLSPSELKAKAVVCRVMEKEATEGLRRDERVYVRFFVREVEDFLAAQADH